MFSRAKSVTMLVLVACGAGGCIEQQTPISILPMTTGMPSLSGQTPTATPLIQEIVPDATLPAEVGTCIDPQLAWLRIPLRDLQQ